MNELDETIKHLCRQYGFSHLLESIADHIDWSADHSARSYGNMAGARNLKSLARNIRAARETAFPDVQARNPHK